MPVPDGTTKRRRKSRLPSLSVTDPATATLHRTVMALRAECQFLRSEVDKRSGCWTDADVDVALKFLTDERDDALRAAVEAFQQAEDARARGRWLQRRLDALSEQTGETTDAVMCLEEENRLLRRRLDEAMRKIGGDSLKNTREIARRNPIESHACNPNLPRHVKALIAQNGCRPEPDLGVGYITLVTCEAIRLTEAIAKTEGCWHWLGRLGATGYGQFNWDGRGWMAHRLVYAIMVGAIPFGYTLDHLCRNKGCVRPDHMEPVTQAENSRRNARGEVALAMTV